jgi:hypothetical protein
LLHGGNGDPFYTPTELQELERAFFADAAVVEMLEGTSRPKGMAGGATAFLQDPENWRNFWRKHCVGSDEVLFKQFCLREQGLS